MVVISLKFTPNLSNEVRSSELAWHTVAPMLYVKWLQGYRSCDYSLERLTTGPQSSLVALHEKS